MNSRQQLTRKIAKKGCSGMLGSSPASISLYYDSEFLRNPLSGRIATVVRHAEKPNYIMKALILIDIQNGLTEKKSLYNEKGFFDSVNSAVKAYRDSDSKIIFVQHNNNQLKYGSSDWEIDKRIDKQETDYVIQKKYGNAFQRTDLRKILIDLKIDSITIGGLVSHGCVKSTCLGALAEGFETTILKNGHTNWNKDAALKISQTENELAEKGVMLMTI